MVDDSMMRCKITCHHAYSTARRVYVCGVRAQLFSKIISWVVGHSGYTKAVEVAPSSAYLVLGGRATLAALRAARGHQGGVHYLYDLVTVER